MSNGRVWLVTLVGAAVCAGGAAASATPVGRLPNGPTTQITVRSAHSFTIRLPKAKIAGRVWRVARAYNASVVRETAEGETVRDVWVTYRAAKAGKTTIVYGLTKGETRHAYAARSFAVTVI